MKIAREYLERAGRFQKINNNNALILGKHLIFGEGWKIPKDNNNNALILGKHLINRLA